MRSRSQEQLAAGPVGVSVVTLSRDGLVYIRSTLRHFDNNVAGGVKMAHLFFVREGWLKWKSENFKSSILGPVLEIGTMTGLLRVFW